MVRDCGVLLSLCGVDVVLERGCEGFTASQTPKLPEAKATHGILSKLSSSVASFGISSATALV